jgi:glycosyltransferase involved in cell wall biosynthesis
MKVAFIVENISRPGGVSLHIKKLVTDMPNFVTAHLITSAHQSHSVMDKYPDKIKFHFIKYPKIKLISQLVFSFYAYKYVKDKKIKFDYLHLHGLSGFYFSLLNLFGKKGKYKKIFYKVHGLPSIYKLEYLKALLRFDRSYLRLLRYSSKTLLEIFQLPLFYVLDFVALHGADHIIAISEFIKNELTWFFFVPQKKVSVIYNGLNKIFLEEQKKDYHLNNIPQILYVGGYGLMKGLPYLLMALEYLKLKDYCLDIIGFGNEKKIIKLLSKLRYTGEVKIVGFVFNENLIDFYTKSDLIVIPTLAEAFGNVLVEAMAVGTPILASNSGSFRELVGSKRGVLFEKSDSKDIAQKIEMILGNYQKRKKMAKNAQKWVSENISWIETAQKTVNLLSR